MHPRNFDCQKTSLCPSVSHISGSEIGLQGMFNPCYDQLTISCFYTKEALSVWTNLGKHFVVRLVTHLKYKDWHKTRECVQTNYLS